MGGVLGISQVWRESTVLQVHRRAGSGACRLHPIALEVGCPAAPVEQESAGIALEKADGLDLVVA